MDQQFRRAVFLTLFVIGAVVLRWGPESFAYPLDTGTVTEVTGELTVLHEDDFDNRKSKLSYFLEDKVQHQRLKLKFKGKMPDGVHSGAIIRVRGQVQGQEFVLAADGTTNLQVLAAATTVVSGDQKTLVMVANFSDAAVSCSVPTIRDQMFTDPNNTSIDDLYRETSFGQVSFSGQVVGPYAINYTSTQTCDPNAWADAIDAAAQTAGVNVSLYTRKVYVLPKNSNCTYSGVGQVGGSPTRSWSFRCDLADVLAHELGHNLGMGHAATPTNDYGDTSDVMGVSGWGLRHVNASHKEQMGWISSEQTQTITQSGMYSLASLETNPTATPLPLTLKIFKPDTGDYYYISYRQPVGFDAGLAYSYLNRLSIHRYAGDGTPKKTILLKTLGDSESFIDSLNQLTVTQVSHTTNNVTIQVQLNTTCTRNVPTITLSPTSQSSGAGTTLTYTVSVTNTDASTCPQSSFALNRVVPSGWSGTISPTTLALTPGQSGSATVTVTSPTSATTGTYGVTVNVSDANTATHTNSANASYIVSTVCTRAAPTVVVSPSNQSANAGTSLSYSVSVTNKDVGGCSAGSFALSRILPSGWSGNISPSSLTLNPGQAGAATLVATSPSSASEGTYNLTVSATDSLVAGHTSSASASYGVTTLADTQAPTAPTGLTAKVKGKQVLLTWNPATDNMAVSKYILWRNAVHLSEPTTTSYNDNTASGGVTYIYYVVAVDAAGNTSALSNAATVTIVGKK